MVAKGPSHRVAIFKVGPDSECRRRADAVEFDAATLGHRVAVDPEGPTNPRVAGTGAGLGAPLPGDRDMRALSSRSLTDSRRRLPGQPQPADRLRGRGTGGRGGSTRTTVRRSLGRASGCGDRAARAVAGGVRGAESDQVPPSPEPVRRGGGASVPPVPRPAARLAAARDPRFPRSLRAEGAGSGGPAGPRSGRSPPAPAISSHLSDASPGRDAPVTPMGRALGPRRIGPRRVARGRGQKPLPVGELVPPCDP
jgi:hypothetical protein